MKYFVQSLLIFLLFFSNGILASNNTFGSNEKLQEIKDFLSNNSWAENPEKIQNNINRIMYPEIYGDEGGLLYKTEMLVGLRTHTLVQEWNTNNSTWEDAYQIFNTYNGNNSLTQVLEQEWDGSGWVDYSRATYTFDANGNNTEYILEFWYGSWLPFYKNINTYDASGWLIEQILQIGFTGTLENYAKYISTNHTGGYPIETLKYDWESNAWDYDGKMNFYYDATWQMIEWIVLDSTDVNSSKSTWAYDANGNQTEELDQEWDGSAWENEDIYTWTYDANNNMIEEVEQTWNVSAWLNVKKEINTYDANNNRVTELDQEWNGSAWEDSRNGVLSYDGSNNCLEEIWQNWSFSSTWENDEKLIHQYSPVGDIGDINELLPNEFSLSNYPNPFNPQTTITFILPQASTISLKVYDITGKQIKTLISKQKRSAGEQSIQWDGTDDNIQQVASGIYLIKLQSEEYTSTKRCVFIK